MQIDQKKVDSFDKKIKESKKITIIPHNNPDGDAIGSALAIYALLTQTDKIINIYSPSDYAKFLKFLPNNNRIKIIKNHPDNFDTDLIIAVDFNSTGRVKDLEKPLVETKAFKVLIDHHPEPENFADITFSDISYSSTAELVFDIFSKSVFRKYFNKDFAECIFAGILTDTGVFSYNSSNPNTYKVVSKLLELGINKDEIFSNIYDSFSVNRLQFLGHALLNGMTYLDEYKTGYIVITAEDRKKFDEKIGDTENFVNYPLSIDKCKFSAIFIERDHFVKISFRSKGEFSAGEFAKLHFNGGGHKNAAGGESKVSLNETVEKFNKLLLMYKDELA